MMRTFPSGATRDSDEGKIDYAGFGSAIVDHFFGAYMHKHRLQSDGVMRASDNWKNGIPIAELWRSARRHMHDVDLHMDDWEEYARDDLLSSLCGLKFNINAMILEAIRGMENKHVVPDMQAEGAGADQSWDYSS